MKVILQQCTTTSLNQYPYQVSTSYTLRFTRYRLDMILMVKVTTQRLKVKSRSTYKPAHQDLQTTVPNVYLLPTPYSFQDIALSRFSNSRSLRQGQSSNQGHTYTSQPIS